MPKRSASTVKVFYPRYSRAELLERLAEGISLLRRKLPLKKVVLFGSYANSKQTVASDIDLLVTYGGESREDAYALVKNTLNIYGLEPHVYSTDEYDHLIFTLERMTRDGVTLFEDKGAAKGLSDKTAEV